VLICHTVLDQTGQFAQPFCRIKIIHINEKIVMFVSRPVYSQIEKNVLSSNSRVENCGRELSPKTYKINNNFAIFERNIFFGCKNIFLKTPNREVLSLRFHRSNNKPI